VPLTFLVAACTSAGTPSSEPVVDRTVNGVVDVPMETAPPPAPSPEPINTDFECSSVSDTVLAELNSFISQPQVGTLTSDEVTAVLVGPGNDPTEDWWVVVANTPDVDYNLDYFAYLTNAPGAESVDDSQWIRVNAGAGWGNVRWPEEKIVRGQLAQSYAARCAGE